MDKENIFYSSCLKGWLLTRLEKDKSILKASLVELCVLVYFSLQQVSDLKKALIALGIVCFLWSILFCILIFQKNSDYLETIIDGNEQNKNLRTLDRILAISFVTGTIVTGTIVLLVVV